MKKAHRNVGIVNIVFLLLLPGFIVCAVWGTVNAIRYWRKEDSLKFKDHVILAVGVLNFAIIVIAVAAFIYLGEH